MDSEEPPNVRVACSGDIDEVVRLMHDAAAWALLQIVGGDKLIIPFC